MIPSSPHRTLSISHRVQRQLDRLVLRGSRWIPGFQAGQRPSPRTRPASEFYRHRKYVPGDDIRFVDWKASARSEHVYLKEGENPQEATVYLLLDASASMGWGELPKLVKSTQLAIVLAYLALANGDRCFVLPYRQEWVSTVGPLRGKGQMPFVTQALRNLKADGQADLNQAVLHLQNTYAPKGGILMILSDFLAEKNLEAVLDRLPNPHWSVTLLHFLDPEEIEPSLRGDFIFEDIETGATQNYDITDAVMATYRTHLQDWVRQLEMTCRLEKAFYLLLNTAWPLDTHILPRLREEKIVVAR
jgi:uncharacterized protein (DUF58 family)